MRVLVAGGTGLLGRATVAALRSAGHEAVVVSRSGDVAVDVGAEVPDASAVGEVDAIVNLIGIAIEKGENTFARAHVRAVENLIAMARAAGVRRFVHVTVVKVPAARGAYHATKAESEELVRGCDELDWTIVRPGLVYGEGDDMMSNLVGYVRLAPVFPVPGGSPGALQVVDVRDVATAVVRSVEREVAIGKTYDVVGPKRYALAELVGDVSRALGLKTWAPRVPVGLMRLGTRVAESLLPKPPVTSTQLGMLVAGLYGDGDAAAKELELEPRALTPERIVELSRGVSAPIPSVRIAPGEGHADLLAAGRRAWGGWGKFVPVLALAGFVGASALALDGLAKWFAVLAAYGGLVAVALAVPIPWRSLVHASASTSTSTSTSASASTLVGVAVAMVMLGSAVVVVPVLRSVLPEFVAPAQEVYRWADLATGPAAIVFVLIIVGEDIVWRGAVTVLLAGRFGPLIGCIAAGFLFAAAHVVLGPPVLWLAAFVAGTAWAMLAIRTRSLVAVVVCHLLWDAGMIYLRP